MEFRYLILSCPLRWHPEWITFLILLMLLCVYTDLCASNKEANAFINWGILLLIVHHHHYIARIPSNSFFNLFSLLRQHRKMFYNELHFSPNLYFFTENQSICHHLLLIGGVMCLFLIAWNCIVLTFMMAYWLFSMFSNFLH